MLSFYQPLYSEKEDFLYDADSMVCGWSGLGTSLSCGQFALANLLASQEYLMTLISPRIRHIDRKRGEGLSFENKGCSGPGLSQLSKGDN